MGARKKTKKPRNGRKQLSPLNGNYLECCIAPVTLTAEAAAENLTKILAVLFALQGAEYG